MTIYPMPEYDRPEGPPPADAWFWQAGNRWVAVVDAHERSTWWSGLEEREEMGCPVVWTLPITDRPTTGTLVYRRSDGTEVTESA